MSFISVKFVVFFVIVLGLLLLVKDNKKQNIVLLIASYIFYAMGDVRFLILLFGVSLLMWFLGKEISKKKNAKVFLTIGVVADVVVLGVFKYLNFFAESVCNVVGKDFTALNIILPLGISFYIFQSISYLADVYTGKSEAEANPIDVLLYIGFFPQIVSGPIVKSHKFLPQIKTNRTINWCNINEGAQRFLLGVFKKKVIADRLSVCVDAVYSAPAAYSSLSILMAVITYSLQIYYDFSGYSDMAIGIGIMLGFDLGENFNLPYLAKNPSDFWRRWHISLSSWFKDYVYIPMGGSRKGKIRTYLNLFITMLLSGLWHGASWPFVIWGAFHALASVLHKMFCDFKKKIGVKNDGSNVFANIASVLLTYVCVTLLWIPFRTNDMSKALYIVKRLFSFEDGIKYVYDYSVIFLALMVIVELISVFRNNWNNPIKPLNLDKFWNKVALVCFMIVTFIFAYVGDTAFIYAQF